MPGSSRTRTSTSETPGGPTPTSDQRWMGEALRAARASARRGEIPVGAVVVRGERPLARGGNRTVAARDPSAHAEIVALRRASRRNGNHRLVGATLYVTLEPCSMCLGAMIQARILRLVYGAADPKGGGIWLLDLPEYARRANHQFPVRAGVRAGESADLLRGFFRRRRGSVGAKMAAKRSTK